MNALGRVWASLIGLFADDAGFAAAILAWSAAACAVLPRLGMPPGLAAPVFAAGAAICLVWSAVRRAGRR